MNCIHKINLSEKLKQLNTNLFLTPNLHQLEDTVGYE
jgi:hypothetical protein